MHGSEEDRDPFAREIESSLEAGNEFVKIEYIRCAGSGGVARASNATAPQYEYVIRTHRIAIETVRQLAELSGDGPELVPLILIRRVGDHSGEESNGAVPGSGASTPTADVSITPPLPADEQHFTALDFLVRAIASAAERDPGFAPIAEVLIRDCHTDRRARVGKRVAEAGMKPTMFRDACNYALGVPPRNMLGAATLLRAHGKRQAGWSTAEIAHAFAIDKATLTARCRRRLACQFGDFIKMSPRDAAELVMSKLLQPGRKEGRKAHHQLAWVTISRWAGGGNRRLLRDRVGSRRRRLRHLD